MPNTRFFAIAISVAVIAVDAGHAFAQNYPFKPIRVVTTEPGGSSDFSARLIAQELSGSLVQQAIVDNRNGILAGGIVAKSPPDGYTLLLHGSPFWISPLLRDAPYDVLRDFAPITQVASTPNVLVVHPALPVKSVRELISLARARPEELDYASAAAGGSNQLAAELFKSMAKVNIVRIAYRGTGAALIGVLAGEVQMTFPTAAGALPQIRSGKLKALAATSLRPSALLPGLPAMAASGLPGYEAVAINGVFAPAGTPQALVNQLNQEIVRILNVPDIRKRFFDAGIEIIGSTPGQLAETVKAETTKWNKVIREAGIRPE